MPYSGPGSGGVTIGNAVTGGTANRVLFIDGAGDLADSANLTFDGSAFAVGSDITIGFSTDVLLARDAANALALRNGTAAQNLRIYNTFTDASNYERCNMNWTANAFLIRTTQAGTGSARSLTVGTQGANSLIFQTNGNTRITIDTAGNMLWNIDNTLNVGATGGARPQSIFAATSIQIEGNNGLRLTNQTDGAGVAAGTLTNAPTAGDPAIWLPVTVNGSPRFVPCWA